MKITGVETLRLENEDLCYVRVRTDEGVTGLGETCFGPEAVEAYVHESSSAPPFIGQIRWRSSGMLAISRVFTSAMAGPGCRRGPTRPSTWRCGTSWVRRSASQPLYQLWGGRCRDRVRIYNTCAGFKYGQKEARHPGCA